MEPDVKEEGPDAPSAPQQPLRIRAAELLTFPSVTTIDLLNPRAIGVDDDDIAAEEEEEEERHTPGILFMQLGFLVNFFLNQRGAAHRIRCIWCDFLWLLGNHFHNLSGAQAHIISVFFVSVQLVAFMILCWSSPLSQLKYGLFFNVSHKQITIYRYLSYRYRYISFKLHDYFISSPSGGAS